MTCSPIPRLAGFARSKPRRCRALPGLYVLGFRQAIPDVVGLGMFEGVGDRFLGDAVQVGGDDFVLHSTGASQTTRMGPRNPACSARSPRASVSPWALTSAGTKPRDSLRTFSSAGQSLGEPGRHVGFGQRLVARASKRPWAIIPSPDSSCWVRSCRSGRCGAAPLRRFPAPVFAALCVRKCRG